MKYDVPFTSVTLPAGIASPPAVMLTRPGATAASETANPTTSMFNRSPGCTGFAALMLPLDALCSAAIEGGAGAIATTTGYAVVVPLFKRRIAGPGWTAAGITRLIWVDEAERIVAER